MDENLIKEIKGRLAKLEEDNKRLKRRLRSAEERKDGMDDAPLAVKFVEELTGFVGLREIVVSKHPISKILWAFLFIFGLVATIWQTYATATDYFDEPTVTKTKIEASDFYDYPPIVLCYDGWFDAQKTKALGLSKNGFVYSLGYWYTRQTDNPLKLNSSRVVEAKKEFLSVFEKHNFSSLVDFFDSISIDLRNFNTSSALKRQSGNGYYGTQLSREARKILLPHFGFCHAFYVKPADAGLGQWQRSVKINAQFVDATENVVKVGSNVFVLLGDDSDSIYTWGYAFDADTTYYLNLITKKYSFLNSPDFPCTESNLSSATCVNDCFANATKRVLNCYNLNMMNENRYLKPEDYCNYFDPPRRANATETLNSIYKIFQNSCGPDCERDCERVLYDIQVQGQLYDQIQRNGSTVTWVSLNFNHQAVPEGGIMHVQEVSTYSFTQLVSNIGGTLGLFVGATLLTLPQVFFYSVIYVRKIIRLVRKGPSKEREDG